MQLSLLDIIFIPPNNEISVVSRRMAGWSVQLLWNVVQTLPTAFKKS